MKKSAETEQQGVHPRVASLAPCGAIHLLCGGQKVPCAFNREEIFKLSEKV